MENRKDDKKMEEMVHKIRDIMKQIEEREKNREDPEDLYRLLATTLRGVDCSALL